MADEPDNLVLVQLREMRAKLGELDAIRTKLEEHDKRFDTLDKHFEEMRVYVNHALGLGTMSNLKSRELDARMEAEEERRKRHEVRLEEIERRLTRVEEKVD